MGFSFLGQDYWEEQKCLYLICRLYVCLKFGIVYLSFGFDWQERNLNIQQLCLGIGFWCRKNINFKILCIIEGEVVRDFNMFLNFFEFGERIGEYICEFSNENLGRIKVGSGGG